ncbi:hypothetical protein HAX54_023511 [Datura stramonium]|uniref:F-box associated beta-propeller type 1 domain-containing protein n=1 Tax=Datura stramonium TaxID=4076 RepID=A0ABS8UWF4_DATST|nr:hypothetical protein [Datura stramonium]
MFDRVERYALHFDDEELEDSSDVDLFEYLELKCPKKSCLMVLVPPGVEVYSLTSGVWRSISDASPSYILHQNHSVSTYLNGAVHWIASNSSDDDDCNRNANGDSNNDNSSSSSSSSSRSRSGNSKDGSFIVAFDVGTENFSEMSLPDSVAERNPFHGEPFRNLSVSWKKIDLRSRKIRLLMLFKKLDPYWIMVKDGTENIYDGPRSTLCGEGARILGGAFKMLCLNLKRLVSDPKILRSQEFEIGVSGRRIEGSCTYCHKGSSYCDFIHLSFSAPPL